MYLAIEFNSDSAELQQFADYLRQVQFPHRVAEHGEGLALWVYQQSHVALVNELYTLFLNKQLPQHDVLPQQIMSSQEQLGHYPLTLICILFSCLGYLAIKLQILPLVDLFSFQGLVISGKSITINLYPVVIEQILSGEFWRLLTPVFLHFDLLHLAFNMGIFYFLVTQIERLEGWQLALFYIVFSGVISNCFQFVLTPENIFGGMSGVNYALLTYCFLANRITKSEIYSCPQGLFYFAIIMLVVGFSGMLSMVGYNIANWAHLAGVLAGGFLSLKVYFNNRSQV